MFACDKKKNIYRVSVSEYSVGGDICYCIETRNISHIVCVSSSNLAENVQVGKSTSNEGARGSLLLLVADSHSIKKTSSQDNFHCLKAP